MKNRALAFAGAVVLSVTALHAADWPQWQGPDRTRVSKETGLLKEWPKAGPPVVWTATGLGSGYGSMAVAGDRVFVQGTRGRNSVVMALNRADGKEVWSKALGAAANGRPGTRTARHTDRRRRSPVRAQRERRPAWPQDRWHRGLAAQHPPRFRRPAAAMADQRVTAGRRTARDCFSRRAGRRHREAGQDDGRHRLDLEGAQRFRGVFVGHRRRRAGRAHVSDIHGGGRRRRARVRRQADVPLSERRELRGERRDADFLEQQGVLHVRVRHRRRASRSHRAERRGESQGGVLHARA